MERAEYMRIKGELSIAAEQLSATRQDKRKAQDALQSLSNRLHSQRMTPEMATEAHDLIDRLLTLQQQETAHEAQEAQYKRAILGVPIPPA